MVIIWRNRRVRDKQKNNFPSFHLTSMASHVIFGSKMHRQTENLEDLPTCKQPEFTRRSLVRQRKVHISQPITLALNKPNAFRMSMGTTETEVRVVGKISTRMHPVGLIAKPTPVTSLELILKNLVSNQILDAQSL